MRKPLALVLAAGVAGSLAAAEATGDCTRIEDDVARLACYDARELGPAESFLEQHWDLNDRGRRLRPWAHRPTYLLPARWTDAPNARSTAEIGEQPVELDATEVKFQISLKTKLVSNLLGGPGQLWFGYTQQSHLQAYAGSASRPFRETNYEPEAIVAFPARSQWGRWTWRVIGTGVVHQSNGRGEPLSRSWNRVYAFVAGERGNFSLHLRPWWRVDLSEGDNPGITDFIGRFEALALWTPGRQALLGRGRSNLDLDGHHGSLQVDWFFPLRSGLRGNLQVFTGYGESLIDYDHRQTTVGVGILIFDPF